MINRFITLLILTVFVMLIGCEKGENKAEANSKRHDAMDFHLQKLDGKEKVHLIDFKGKPVVLNFWASWCAPCRQEMPFFEKIWNEYKNDGVIFIGIDVLDDEDNAKEFLRDYGISYLNLKDPSGEVANAYSVIGLPATFFIDREGKILKKNYGPFLGDNAERSFISYLKEISK